MERDNIDSKALFRTFTINDISSRESESGDILDISISSEYPVGRDFGNEILSHDISAIDWRYAKNGLPFMLDHKQGNEYQVGWLNDLQVKDSKLRGIVTFTDNPSYSYIEQDMKKGTRKNISVGYTVDEWSLDGDGNALVTKWTPLEASLVPIPADPTVGVGRSLSIETAPEPEVAEVLDSVVLEVKEVEQIEQVEDSALENTEQTLETEVTNESNKEEDVLEEATSRSLEIVETNILLKGKDKMETIKTNGSSYQNELEAIQHEKASYSVGRAIKALQSGSWNDAGFEREVNQALAKFRSNGNPNALYLAGELLGRGANTIAMNNAGKGAEFNYTEYAGFLPMLTPYTAAIKAGAQTVSAANATYQFTKQISRSAAQWNAENGTATTAGTFGTSVVNMTGKTLSDSLELTRNQMLLSPEALDSIVTQDLYTRFGLAIDAAVINGTGANVPTGILQLATGLVGSGKPVLTAIGTDGGALTGTHVTDMISNVDTNAALNDGCSFILSPKVRWTLANTPKNGANVVTPILDNGQIFGFNVFSSSNVPTNLVKGASGAVCHAGIFGDFKSVVIAEFGPMEILVNPYSQSRNQIVQFDANMLVDINYKYQDSFAVVKDIK